MRFALRPFEAPVRVAVAIAGAVLILGILVWVASWRAGFPVSRATLTVAEREWLDAHRGQLRYSVDPNFPPLEYVDAEGRPGGFVADVVKLLEQRLDFEFTFLRFPVWGDMLKGIQNSEIDLVMQIASTPERRRYLNFSRPYTTIPSVIVVRKEEAGVSKLGDLAGKRVGAVSGYAFDELMRVDHPDIALIPMKSEKDGLMKLSIREIDAMIVFISSAAYFIREMGLSDLKIAADTGYDLSFCMAWRRDNPILGGILQKGLDAIGPEEMERTLARWVPIERPGFYESRKFWLALALVLLFAGSLVVAVLTWNSQLRKQVAVQTAELRKAQDYLSAMFDSIRSILVSISPDGRILRVNREVGNYVSGSVERLVGESLWLVLPFLAEFAAECRRAAESRSTVSVRQKTELDGRTVYFNVYFIPLEFEGHASILVRVDDVSESELKEQQLVQSQKMETVGILAGGVAHDFNNLLLPILGFAEMLLAKCDPKGRDVEYVRQILQAAERAKDLTKRLLVFGRKQVLELTVIDLAVVLKRFEALLRRTIRESITIRCSVGADLFPVMADAGQIEQVLLNLAVNAQDAIANSGTLSIAAANTVIDGRQAAQLGDLQAGPYVVLTVHDDGCGMSAETVGRIFEPFFTTKEMGRGTGLGLAIVHGIIKQHHGHIGVSSAVGLGTTFEIYLPAAMGEGVGAKSEGRHGGEQLVKGSETVLLVEDNEMVRKLVTEVLTDQGYTVLKAADGIAALSLASSATGKIDMLLTDVIMPNLNGKELSEKIRLTNPGVKTLFISGYSGDIISRHGVLVEDVNYLQKPFSVNALLQKVRAILDS